MLQQGKRVVRTRFGVDSDTCTGDHSCIRISACPSLTIRPNGDPLKSDPVAFVDNQCVGCGLCGKPPTRRCSAPRSTARKWSRTRAAGTASNTVCGEG